MAKTCETCRWWDLSADLDRDDAEYHQCRRHSPHFADDRSGVAVFPFTEGTDWCGEHEADPDRVKDDDEDPEELQP